MHMAIMKIFWSQPTLPALKLGGNDGHKDADSTSKKKQTPTNSKFTIKQTPPKTHKQKTPLHIRCWYYHWPLMLIHVNYFHNYMFALHPMDVWLSECINYKLLQAGWLWGFPVTNTKYHNTAKSSVLRWQSQHVLEPAASVVLNSTPRLTAVQNSNATAFSAL